MFVGVGQGSSSSRSAAKGSWGTAAVVFSNVGGSVKGIRTTGSSFVSCDETASTPGPVDIEEGFLVGGALSCSKECDDSGSFLCEARIRDSRRRNGYLFDRVLLAPPC